MPQSFTIILGKAVRYAARLRGGGSALPGLFVERISPSFVPETLAQLPHGVVVISGTNGKTTTTKMVVALLESLAAKVASDSSGSDVTFEFHQLDDELRIEARCGDRKSEARHPLPAAT